MKLTVVVKNILIQIGIFFFVFIAIDIIYSFLKNNSDSKIVDPNAGLHKQNSFGFYWLDSSINKGNYTFGSIKFPIYTNEYGFRCSKGQSVTKDSIEYVFLGDSFTYGEGEWEESFVGLFEKKQKKQLFNCGVPSYSPSVYLYQYKKAIVTGKLKTKHKVIICLDISDVQDESTRWYYPDKFFRNQDENGIVFPILMKEAIQRRMLEAAQSKTNKSNNSTSIKQFVSNNMLLTSYIYVSLKKIFYKKELAAERDSLFEANKFLNRSGITHIPWKQLDSASEMGYQPIGVSGGIQKIEKALLDIKGLVQKNNAEVYLVVYPWPAQLLVDQLVFNWESYWKSFAIKNNMYYINCFESFREKITQGANPQTFYIENDIHFNKHGNEIIANKIIKSIKQ